jgi:tetratricopeptide (TPR) repeat protein
MTAIFGSLPVASRIFLGVWGFEGAAELACLCALAGGYLTIRARRLRRLPDPATMLDEASLLASKGRIDRAIARLTRTIDLSPQLWQAYQYRGELRLRSPESIAEALEDFSAAIKLAPSEAHLYTLRGNAHRLLGDEEAARRDDEIATRLR